MSGVPPLMLSATSVIRLTKDLLNGILNASLFCIITYSGLSFSFLSDGVVYMYNADGTAEPLAPEQYLNYKDARPEPTESNAKELWLDRNYFISSFMIKAAFSEDAKRLRDELNKLENPMSRIKVRALRLSVADQRIERIFENIMFGLNFLEK